MSASTSPLGAGTFLSPTETSPQKLAAVIRAILEGRLNCVGKFTLASNATSTIVSQQPIVGPYSVLHWQPVSSNAAPQMTLMYVTSQIANQFTIAHGSNSHTDQTFVYVAIG